MALATKAGLFKTYNDILMHNWLFASLSKASHEHLMREGQYAGLCQLLILEIASLTRILQQVPTIAAIYNT